MRRLLSYVLVQKLRKYHPTGKDAGALTGKGKDKKMLKKFYKDNFYKKKRKGFKRSWTEKDKNELRHALLLHALLLHALQLKGGWINSVQETKIYARALGRQRYYLTTRLKNVSIPKHGWEL